MRRALPAVVFALLVAAVYADPLFTGRLFSGRDLIALNHPIEKAIHDAYSRGRLPVWIEEISGGRPLLANPNAGALYPARAALAIVPFPLAMRLFPVLHWAVSGFGMIVLLGSLGASRTAALLGAVTYVFSGVGVSQCVYTNLHPGVTLLPWIVWAARRAAPIGRKAPLLGLLFGLDLLAGDVFTVGLGAAAAALWVVLEVEPALRRHEALAISVGVGLALLLALPQLAATALWASETHRAVLGMKLAEVTRFAISPLRLLELFVPYPFGPAWTADESLLWASPIYNGKSLGLYATLFAGPLAVVGIASRRLSGPGARFGRGFFVLCAAVSMAWSLLPESALSWPSPVPLRFPEKFAVGLAFSLALLAGLALDRVRRTGERPAWPLAAAGLLALAAAAAALWPARAGAFAVALVGAGSGLSGRAGASLPFAFAEAGLCWVCAAIGLELLRRPGTGALASAAVLLSGAVVLPDRSIAQTFPTAEILAPTAFARVVRRSDPAGEFRVLGESLFRPPSALERVAAGADPGAVDRVRRSWQYDTQALWGRGAVLNYDLDVGDLSRVESLRRFVIRSPEVSNLADLFATIALRWGIRYRDQPPLPGFRRFGGDALQDWDEAPAALPDVRLSTRWREVRTSVEALAAMRTLSAGDVVVESGAAGEGSARPGSVRLYERSPERLRLVTRCQDPAWLFVLRAWWSHRTVVLDGRQVECVPAQLAYSAVALPAGEHRVDWTEEVPGGSVSRGGPILCVLLVAFLAARRRRMQRE